MLLQHLSSSTTAVALVLLVGLTTGCNSGPSTSTDVPDADSVSSTAQDTIRRQLYQKAFMVERPAVTAHERDCIRKDFPIYVQQQAQGAQKEFEDRNPALELTVGGLKAAVAGLSCDPGSTGDIKHAVIVHHGLLANGEYDAFLQVVCLTYDTSSAQYEYPATDEGYTVDGNGGLVFDATGLSKWNGSGGPGELYQSKTYILPEPGGTWAVYDRNRDVRAMAFPYELQLEDLIAHNNLSDTDRLRLEPYAEATVRNPQANGTYEEKGYYHGVVWVPVGVTLGNDPLSQPAYKARAANLGAPCPVNCANSKFQFRTTGVRARKVC